MPSGPVDMPGRQDHPSAAVGPTTPSFDRFQILALDGGGAKALFTAHVLARLEQDLQVAREREIAADEREGRALGRDEPVAPLREHAGRRDGAAGPARR